MNMLQNVLHKDSITNITYNSAVNAEMQMSSDKELVTLGLCVCTVTATAEPRDHYAILISNGCSSSPQRGVRI
jgi:hypothetical protein